MTNPWVLQEDGSYFDEETKRRLSLRDGLSIEEYLARPSRPAPVLLDYGAFRARWEASELEALFSAKNTDWRVEDYVTLASAQGHVNLSGETAAAAKALFVQMGVLTVERADVIFAAGE